MEPKQIAKQMIDFSKTAFDNSFEAMAVLLTAALIGAVVIALEEVIRKR